MTDLLTRNLLTDTYLQDRHRDLQFAYNQPVQLTDRQYRVLAVLSLITATFSAAIIPGLVALALGHYVLHNTEPDLPNTDTTRGYATIGLIIAYASFAVMIFLVLLPKLL